MPAGMDMLQARQHDQPLTHGLRGIACSIHKLCFCPPPPGMRRLPWRVFTQVLVQCMTHVDTLREPGCAGPLVSHRKRRPAEAQPTELPKAQLNQAARWHTAGGPAVVLPCICWAFGIGAEVL
jgi:hypothetical protein